MLASFQFSVCWQRALQLAVLLAPAVLAGFRLLGFGRLILRFEQSALFAPASLAGFRLLGIGRLVLRF